MHTQDFVVDQRTNWQVLERLAKLLPNFHAIFVKGAFARVFKTVYLVDQTALVVAAKHVHFSRVTQLLGEKQSDHFYIVGVPVYVITLKQIRFVRGRPYLVEKPE